MMKARLEKAAWKKSFIGFLSFDYTCTFVHMVHLHFVIKTIQSCLSTARRLLFPNRTLDTWEKGKGEGYGRIINVLQTVSNVIWGAKVATAAVQKEIPASLNHNNIYTCAECIASKRQRRDAALSILFSFAAYSNASVRFSSCRIG